MKTTVKPTDSQSYVFMEAFDHAFSELITNVTNEASFDSAWRKSVIRAADTLAVFNYYCQIESNPHPSEDLA